MLSPLSFSEIHFCIRALGYSSLLRLSTITTGGSAWLGEGGRVGLGEGGRVGLGDQSLSAPPGPPASSWLLQCSLGRLHPLCSCCYGL